MDGIGARGLSRELVGIQYLRGLAAVMVIAFHLGHQLTRMGYAGPWPGGLAAGVDVFFVISGFIMWLTTRNDRTGPAEFLKRRILRIVPLYWLFTVLMVAVLIGAPNLLRTTVFDPVQAAASFVFVPALNRATGQLEPVLQVGWTLNYEMFFYAIFAGLLAAPRAIRFWALVVGLAALAVGGAVLAAPATSLAAFYTSSVLVEFAIGVALARLVTETELLGRVSPAVAAVLSVASLGAILVWPALLPPDLPTRLATGLSAAVLVASLLALEARGALPRLAVPRLLGDASYSIYLSQVLTLSAASQLWTRLHLDARPGGWAGFVVFGIVVGALGGVMVYWLVERPMNAALRARRHGVVPAARLVPTSAG